MKKITEGSGTPGESGVNGELGEENGEQGKMLTSLMTRSMSNSSPPDSPLRRNGNRCSWTHLPISSFPFTPSANGASQNAAALSNPDTETLSDDKSTAIKSSPGSVTTENASFAISHSSLNEVDSALAEVILVIFGLTDLCRFYLKLEMICM